MEEDIAKSAVTLSGILVSLFPVMIGGLLAIGGALTGTLLTYFLSERSKRKAMKREKLEQLLCAANRTEHWLDEYKNTKLGVYEKDIGSSPIAEVKYLNELYLNELDTEVINFSLVAAEYTSLIAACHFEKQKAGVIPSNFIDEYTPIIKKLTRATSLLVEKAGKVARDI